MSTQSAGDMFVQSLKTLGGAILRVLVVAIAWVIELGGKLLLWISDKIKQNAK